MVVVPAAKFSDAAGEMMRPFEALLIDRQPLFLAALASLLTAPPLSARIHTSPRSDEGLEMVRNGALDLVCCELRAEPLSGVELVQVLSQEGSSTRVVLLGDEGDEAELAAALSTNVAGLFTKSAGLDEFLAGVRAVTLGHRAIGSALVARLLERLAPPLPPESLRFANQLSPTELEILAMIGRAQSIPTIAASRGISHKTVRNHLAKIYRKLDLHGKTEAMLWATRMGLTSS
jgi:DNA-binding NarL/FixJ family response regulator